MVAVAGDALGDVNARGAVLLTAQGVQKATAEAIADTVDIGLIKACVEFWRTKQTGPKAWGAGMLVDMCRKPTEYGFTLRDGCWYEPPIVNRKRNGKIEEVSVSVHELLETIEERAAKSAQIHAEDQRAAAAFKRLPKINAR